MAAIDKIYATKEQRTAFYAWCKINKPEALKYFYPWYPENDNDGFTHAITNFPERIDRWMLMNLHEPGLEWVIERIREQYGYGWSDNDRHSN